MVPADGRNGWRWLFAALVVLTTAAQAGALFVCTLGVLLGWGLASCLFALCYGPWQVGVVLTGAVRRHPRLAGGCLAAAVLLTAGSLLVWGYFAFQVGPVDTASGNAAAA
jgi:hypothetical protein